MVGGWRGGGGAVGSLPTEGHSFGVPSDLTTSRRKDTTVAAILSSLLFQPLCGTVTETVDSAQRKQMLKTTPVTRQSVVLESPAPPHCWRNS